MHNLFKFLGKSLFLVSKGGGHKVYLENFKYIKTTFIENIFNDLILQQERINTYCLRILFPSSNIYIVCNWVKGIVLVVFVSWGGDLRC